MKRLFLLIALLCASPLLAQDNWAYNFVTTGTRTPGITFANTSLTAFAISWDVSPPVLSCALQVDSSADGISWGSGDLIATQNCAVVGSVAATSLASGKNFVRVNVTAFNGNGGVNVKLRGYAGAGSSSFSSGALDATSSAYAGGVKMGRICFSNNDTITVTNGSATVVCNNANFTQADVGSDIEAIAGGCCGGSTVKNGLLALGATSGNAQTTILTRVSATTVTVSANAIAGCTANCILMWGPNNDAALTALDTAVQALSLCGQIQLPSGGPIMFSHVHWNYTGTRCVNSATGLNYGYGVTGWGPGATWLAIESNFFWSECVFASTVNSCLFNYPQAELSYFSIWGAAYGATGNNSKILVNTGLGSQLNQLSLMGFGGSDTNAIGISLSGGDRVWGLACDAFGRICGISTSSGINVPNYAYWSFWGDTLNENFQAQSGVFIDYGGEYGGQGSSAFANLRVTGIYYGYGSGIFNAAQNGASCVGLWVSGAGVAYLWGGQWDASAIATCDGAAVTNSGILYSEGSTFKGGASAFAVSVQNTAQFVDMGGGNQFQGTAPFQFLNTGAYVPYKSVAGTATGVGTAASTLALRISGTSTTGTGIPTTFTSTTLDAGNVMDRAGNLYALQVTATAAGTNASSGVVTVLKNGVATTVTCTIGTATSCSDGTHVATFVRGDLISMQATTQAADTLAGVKAVVAAY